MNNANYQRKNEKHIREKIMLVVSRSKIRLHFLPVKISAICYVRGKKITIATNYDSNCYQKEFVVDCSLPNFSLREAKNSVTSCTHAYQCSHMLIVEVQSCNSRMDLLRRLFWTIQNKLVLFVLEWGRSIFCSKFMFTTRISFSLRHHVWNIILLFCFHSIQ